LFAVVSALASAAAMVLVAATFWQAPGGATGKARPIFTAIAKAYATQCLTEKDPDTLCLNGEGFAKPTGGSIGLSRVHGKGNQGDYYFLSIDGEVGHQMRAILEVMRPDASGCQHCMCNFACLCNVYAPFYCMKSR